MSFRIWVLVAICLFGIGMVLGLTATGGLANLLTEELAVIEKLGTILGPFTVSTAVFILIKNLSALLLSFIFSPVLCLLPILALTVNGGLLSFISAVIIHEKSLGFLLAGLLPHGIFELPAIIIGEAAALSFGAMVVVLLVRHGWSLVTSFVRKGGVRILLIPVLFTIVGIFPSIIILALLNLQTRPIVIENLKQNAWYLVIACILLVPAAIIETYITPLFLT